MFERFEGWYFKQRCGADMLAFIPGRAADGAFVQMIGSGGTRCFFLPDFAARGDTVRVGSCLFSPRGIRVRLPGVEGSLRYGALAPLRSDIMGPFAHLPMQCRHGVMSMRHRVDGCITINGTPHRFDGGSGYIEKDSGRSFPRAYLWVQCERFPEPCALMFSAAHIPFLGASFTGCICALLWQGTEYRFATYRGVRIEELTPQRVRLRQGEFRLELDMRPLSDGHALAAPQAGRMSATIRESCNAALHLRLLRGGTLLLDTESNEAAYEHRKAER